MKGRTYPYLQVVVAVTAFAAATSLGVLLYLTRPEPMDPHNRTVGRGKVRFRILRAVDAERVRFCLCHADEEFYIGSASGFRTRASLYRSHEHPARGGIVLVHGNVAAGRRMSLYPVLATKLAAAGWSVLTYDKLGFGESDDPFGLGSESTAAGQDRVEMLRSAIGRLHEEEPAARRHTVLIGHSGGAIAALKVGLRTDLARDIVLIGPPRRVYENAEREEREGTDYYGDRFRDTYRWVYGKLPPDWLTTEMIEAGGPWGLEDYLEPLQRADHLPVLLVDGERESEVDRTYLEDFAGKLANAALVRIADADHYKNTAQIRHIEFYDQVAIDQLVGAIDAWLGGERDPRRLPGGLVLPALE